MGSMSKGTSSPKRRVGLKLSAAAVEENTRSSSLSMQRSQSDPRAGLPRSGAVSDSGASRAGSPKRNRQMSRSITSGGGASTAANGMRLDVSNRSTSSRMDASNHVGNKETAKNAPTQSWWNQASMRRRPIMQQGWMRKRGGRMNNWPERYYVLGETLLEQYGKGEDAETAEPKHIYELVAGCSVSEIKEVKTGGKIIFSFQLEWPPVLNAKSEAETEGADSTRAGHDEDSGDSEGAHPCYGSPVSDLPTPLDSPVDIKNRRGGGEDGSLPFEPPLLHRVTSNGSLQLTNPSGPQGPQQELRVRRPRCNTTTGIGHSSSLSGARVNGAPVATPPTLCKKLMGKAMGGDDECRNETIEHMVAAQRKKESHLARLKQEELDQLTEYEQEKNRRLEKQKKKDKKNNTTRGQAVVATAVGASWLTAGIATGGLVLAGGLVAAGVTMGSVGVYNKYKNSRNANGNPSRVRLANEKLELAEQWRNTIQVLLENLEAIPLATEMREGSQMWMGRGLGLGIPWSTVRPETPPPRLKAIDLGVVDEMLANAVWISRDVVQGLPILEQNLSAFSAGSEPDGVKSTPDEGGVEGGKGWGLGGEGPVLKSQTIVRASALETFVALMGAPRNYMNAVVSGIIPVQCMDDHSDVVRLYARPAWLGVAWASPRDFCLARYWHSGDDGCYIVCMSSMEHAKCPMETGYVRGELHTVYTISPRRDHVPGADASPECLLACHVQVDPKGWAWSSFGFRERYTSHILMHVLEVRNVIEAERFIAPRINLRPDSPTDSARTPQSAEENGPFLFEVLGVSGSQRGAVDGDEEGNKRLSQRGPTSLENHPAPTLDPRMWAEADATEFSVRGGSYLTNRVKVQSAKQMFRLRAVDMFLLPEPATHLASHPSNRVQIARKAGETSFVWILQIMVPGPPHYAFVCYFTPGDESWRDTSTPFGKLAERVFFGDDNAFRDSRLKLIPKIVEGNWVVKRAAGSTPAILGSKLKQHHFRGNNYLETDLEIGSSSVAANITRLCTGYAKSLVVDMAWTIQGNTEEELPEVVLAGVRIDHLDMMSAKPFNPSAQP